MKRVSSYGTGMFEKLAGLKRKVKDSGESAALQTATDIAKIAANYLEMMDKYNSYGITREQREQLELKYKKQLRSILKKG